MMETKDTAVGTTSTKGLVRRIKTYEGTYVHAGDLKALISDEEVLSECVVMMDAALAD